MIFVDSLPNCVTIDNMIYPINSDFRVMAAYEIGMQKHTDKKMPIAESLNRFYIDGIPCNIDEAIGKMLWFYQCGKEVKEKNEDESQKKVKQIYSFEEDEGYIFSAFLDQYGINLISIDLMHWWVFKRLFDGLKSDNEFVKIMGYRAAKLDGKMPLEQRKFYRKMQKQYALTDHRSEEQKEIEMVDALASFF